ncbi:MAG: neutral zinc metallopeptidase [Ilumatobacteraceae bacterium]
MEAEEADSASRSSGGGGGGGGGGIPIKAGGGLLGLIVVLAMAFLPKLLGGGASAGSSGYGVPSAGLAPADEAVSSASGGNPCDTEIAQIVCGGVEDVQTFWDKTFSAAGRDYAYAPTVFFSGATQTGCGPGQAQMGPFYCPLDSKVYFDLDFLVQLQNQFGAQGDLAAQYIVAHEYGHHIQNVLGISDQVRTQQQRNPSQANALSVRLELQADCLAGVWAHDAKARNQFDNANEINEALNAAAAVGDDTIQKRSGGYVDPDSFTHGTSQQRVSWFTKGYESGSSDSCDTFSE